MDFNHSEDRQMLSDTLGRYLQQRYPIDVRHRISGSDAGWSVEQWATLADMGVVGALFGEAAGGFGGGGFDIAAVFEQLGRALVVEPFLGTLMAGRILAAAGGQAELLEAVIAGDAVLAFAHQEPQSHYDLSDVATQAERGGGGWLLTGAKAVVPHLEAASHILLSARIGEGDKGIGLFLIAADAAGIGARGYPLIDGGRGAELTLSATSASLIAEHGLPLIEEAIAAGITALAWEAVGVMDVLKRDTLDYLRTRKQFGVPIGKFQALQHRMATMALEIEQARSAAINAAAALDGDRIARERAASAAKFTIGRVGTIAAEEAIQLHGGIGMTWELPLSHYAKRLTMIGHQLGDEDHHLARYSALGRAA
jgi:alkylation response protein AidB-like acyl-CoA dehydrogenase